MAITARNAGWGGILFMGLVAYGVTTLWHEADTASTVEGLKAKVGVDLFNRFVKGLSPMAYGDACEEMLGELPGVKEAVKSYYDRNKAKMLALLSEMKAKGGMSEAEKDTIDRYVYKNVRSEVQNDHIICVRLIGQIDGGDWDL